MRPSARRRLARSAARLGSVALGAILLASCPAAAAGENPAPRPEVGPANAGRLGCPEVGGRASDAPATGRNARWGMTVDEVVTAFPGEAVRASPAEVEKGSGPVRIDRCEIAGTSFQANFFFYRASRLTQISLGPASKRDASRPLFDRLAKMLTDKYGQPATDVLDQTLGVAGLRTTQKTWQAPEVDIGLTYMYGGDEPFLSLVYRAPPPRPDADKK